ncbi:right-handed parallel beta-helix repeat-containing protein, partial [bacterium]|nr:right-handed parallel beta-helix repeat-containing protein [bacterium]
TCHIEIVSNTFGNGSNGIWIQSENANMIFQNNLINNLQGWGIQVSEYNYNALIANNVISNSGVGFYIRNNDGEFMDNYRMENNLFINNDTILQLRRHDQVYQSFRYNACFDFDTLGNDTNYFGRMTQVNTNGDSCDAGFNIFLDPHIASLDTLDFRLYLDSPLIDAGNPDSAFFDIDGTVNDIGLYGGPYGVLYLHPQNVGKSDVSIPEGFTLDRPYPNPFNISTNFSFNLPAPGITEINIYDTIGRLIFSDKLEELQAGSHKYTWQGIDSKGRPLPTGIYYFELTYKGAKLVKRVVLLK